MTEKFNPKAKGFKEIAWIPAKSLSVIWAEAQRPLNENHAQKIADNFDPEMFGTLTVTKPNGEGVYHVIDGHHRKVAVERVWGGDEKVPCQVFDAEDPARAAELFDHINSARKNPQPVDLFKVRVTAGHETEIAVNRIVNKCGYVVNYRNTGGHNNIVCVAALKAVYESFGAAVLENTLNVIRATWDLDESATEAHIIRGIGEFLSEFRHVDYTRLRTVIAAKYTPARLYAAAKMGREMHGGRMSNEVKKLLIVTYNAGLPAKKKLVSKGEDV